MERFSRFAESAAGQLAEVTRDGTGGRLVDKLIEEIGEASDDVRKLLRGPWRMPRSEIEARTEHLLSGQNITEFGVDAFGFDPQYVAKVIPAACC